MAKATSYRQYAAQCMRFAETARGRVERMRWLHMAQQWIDWAEAADKEQRLRGEEQGEREYETGWTPPARDVGGEADAR
jgi:hypothetical protein